MGATVNSIDAINLNGVFAKQALIEQMGKGRRKSIIVYNLFSETG